MKPPHPTRDTSVPSLLAVSTEPPHQAPSTRHLAPFLQCRPPGHFSVFCGKSPPLPPQRGFCHRTHRNRLRRTLKGTKAFGFPCGANTKRHENRRSRTRKPPCFKRPSAPFVSREAGFRDLSCSAVGHDGGFIETALPGPATKPPHQAPNTRHLAPSFCVGRQAASVCSVVNPPPPPKPASIGQPFRAESPGVALETRARDISFSWALANMRTRLPDILSSRSESKSSSVNRITASGNGFFSRLFISSSKSCSYSSVGSSARKIPTLSTKALRQSARFPGGTL